MAPRYGNRRYGHAFRSPVWAAGDIAFLKPRNELTSGQDAELFRADKTSWSGTYLQEGACGHPVIVAERLSPRSTHVVVLTVSAYGSGEKDRVGDAGYCPPWRHRVTGRPKGDKRDYRAFFGCERPDASQQWLLLREGEKFPKPTTSWVCVKNFWVVPVDALKVFNRQGSGYLLHMQEGSLENLKDHISRRSPIGWKKAMDQLREREPRLVSSTVGTAEAAK